MSEVLLTVPEAADRLNVSPRFIRRLIGDQRITVVRIGRHVRIPEHAITTLITAGTVAPAARWHYGKAA